MNGLINGGVYYTMFIFGAELNRRNRIIGIQKKKILPSLLEWTTGARLAVPLIGNGGPFVVW